MMYSFSVPRHGVPVTFRMTGMTSSTALEALDLKGKDIAIFGCGDESMSDTFCGAVGEIYKRLQGTGAKFIAPFDASVYTFDESPAFIDGVYVGLLLDEVNHPELSDERIKEWTDKIKSEI